MDRTPVHPQPYPSAAEASALGREGALVPPASSPPLQTAAAGDLLPSEPPPLGPGLGRALNGAGAPLPACRHGSQSWKGRNLRPCPLLGGNMDPAKGQGLTLEVLGRPSPPPP